MDKKGSKKVFVHDGELVEVFAIRSDSYELIRRGSEALQVKPATGKQIALFKPSGGATEKHGKRERERKTGKGRQIVRVFFFFWYRSKKS